MIQVASDNDGEGPARTPLLMMEGVTFSVGGRHLVQGVTADLGHGRVYGLIGHNGSGKSTLLKLLAGQASPSRGRIRFRQRDVSSWERRAFAREVAYLPQQPPAAVGLTVRELVALGRYPWHGAIGRFRQEDRDRVEEAMTVTEVDAYADRLVETLSGGERQRAWIASLVAQGTSCLLLDEPTSALDIGHQLQVLGLIRRLAERGACVVVVLHDVNMAARFCDELLALHSGRLIESGPAKALMTTATLKAIYGVDMAVVPHPTSEHIFSIAQ